MLRREFFRVAAASACGATILRGGRAEPVAVQVGDVLPGRGVVWMRSAQPGQMTVRWRTTEKAEGNVRTVRGPMLSAATDFTGRVELRGVPAGQRIFYEAQVEGGAPVEGSFRTAPESGGEVRFLWSGDMVGQGWGINPAIGGIRIFETMRRLEPHFFIHSGDTIYADGPIQAEVKLPGGAIWKNLVTEEKGKAAESLDEFRGAYRYNLLDENVRRFTSEIPQVWQWDDHEVLNNWSPGKDLGSDGKYQEKNVQVLVSRARRAFLEYAPIRLAGSRIHRKITYGPLLDLFVLDMRSYRAANSWNRQPAPSPETAFLGAAQINWLKHDLRRSKATWKVIAADMPIALLVSDGKDRQGRPMFEASANGNGPALGRELEIADLLRDMKRHNVRNTIWL
ncbi:MAG TPA: alkaline phosphatase D family protein, partial [Bryobacteraceae bacterium]|nr:alkaline phosphatase D family protein [Bryobacteraceae bacterium]